MRIAYGAMVIGTIPGLFLTTAGGWSKFHLFWMIPTSIVAVSLAMLPIALLARRVNKQGFQVR